MTTIRHFPNFAPNLTLRSLAASSKGTILLIYGFCYQEGGSLADSLGKQSFPNWHGTYLFTGAAGREAKIPDRQIGNTHDLQRQHHLA